MLGIGWLRQFFGARRGRKRGGQLSTSEPHLEHLEDRLVPSRLSVSHGALPAQRLSTPPPQVASAKVNVASTIGDVLGNIAPDLFAARVAWSALAGGDMDHNGYALSAAMLRHSLQANPGSLNLSNPPWDFSASLASEAVAKIRRSPEFGAIVKDVVASLPKGPKVVPYTQYNDVNRLANFTSDKDLQYSIGKFGVAYFGQVKKDGSWSLTFVLQDMYNFEWKSYEKVPLKVTAGNNASVLLQLAGAIVPYSVRAEFAVTGMGKTVLTGLGGATGSW